jgi:hypothetical protein
MISAYSQGKILVKDRNGQKQQRKTLLKRRVEGRMRQIKVMKK